MAELSPTNAYSNTVPARRASPARFPSSLFALWSRSAGIGLDEEDLLPQSPEYPLQREVLGQLEEVEQTVHRILVKNDWAVKKASTDSNQKNEKGSHAEHTGEEADEEVLSLLLKSDSPTPTTRHTSRPITIRIKPKAPPDPLTSGGPQTQSPWLTGESPLFDGDKSHTLPRQRSVVVTEREIFVDSDGKSNVGKNPASTNKGSGRKRSKQGAQSCPRIRRGEDLRDYSQRLASSTVPPTLDGTYDSSSPPTAVMNNFGNFDTGNMNPNLARQAPAQPQGQQMNGLNGVQQWPNVGAQSDMNVLWEYIMKLSDMHEQIRAQTQSVASGMQQIDSMRANGASSAGGAGTPHVNGVVNGTRIFKKHYHHLRTKQS